MLKEIFHPIYEVHTAGNGKEGFEQALTIQPDIVPVSYTHLDVYKRQVLPVAF